MKKALKKTAKTVGIALAVLTMAVVILIVIFAIKGYCMYSEAISEKSVQSAAAEIRGSQNFAEYEDLPQFYIDAVISVEDKRFFSHNGIDMKAIGRALLNDIKTLSFAEGGSTITQQLAKNLWFTQEKTIERKFAEVFMAHKIESELSKQEIFELYVNSIYFGEGYYGIENAAEGYYNKPAAELDYYQCAMLAGLPNAPSVYSPLDNPELAKQRLSRVLDRMVSCEVIDPDCKQEIMCRI